MSSTLDIFCGSQFWDSDLTWNTTNPDFTVCFQRTVLVWIPITFLWMFAPFEAYNQIKSTRRTIPWNGLNVSKLVVTLLLVVNVCAELIYSLHRHVSSIHVPSVDYNTPFVLLVTYFLVCLLHVSGKRRGVISSGPIFIFWFLMVICTIPTFRSHILKAVARDEDQDRVFLVTTTISFPLLVLQFILTCFADLPPKEKQDDDENTKNVESPEETASFLSQLLFFWLSPLMLKGFKNPLVEDDLWKLNTRDKTASVAPVFDKFWEMEIANRPRSLKDGVQIASFNNKGDRVEFRGGKHDKSPSVMKVLLRAFWPMFVFGSFLKFISDLLQFVAPQILRLLIEFTTSDEPLWKGIFYACLMFTAAELQSLCINQYFIRMNLVAMHVRSSLISALYRKALTLSNEERKDSTIGEIVNLMSIDTQRFIDVMPFANMLWSGPLQISLALFFLWQTLGASVLAGVAVMIIMIPLNGVIASVTRKLQMKNMKLKDERTKLMSEVLNGIRVLKLYAWEIPFMRMILDIRGKEIKVLTKSAYLSAGISFLWSCAPFLVSLASFATFVLSDPNNVLDSKTAFVSLALFNLLRFPLNMLPNLITMLVQVSVSVKRLNKFMGSQDLDKKTVSHDQFEMDPVVIEEASFTWGGVDDPNVLTDIDLKIKEGSLVAVVGQVGSGKSSLISAILGELVKRQGRVNVKGSIAYVPQQAWIQNATLRENILMYKPLKEEFYDKVVESCALKTDLKILPGGDQTEIGEKGINLSGGQKQRISLARAVYHNSDIYLFDDPLSAVDAHVGRHIFDHIIGPNSMLSSKTRLLVTHGISFLPQCDVIVVLKDGRISESGSYKELMCKKGAFSEFMVQYMTEEIDCMCDEELEQLDEIISNTPVTSEVKNQFLRQFSKSESENSSLTGPYSPKHSILSDGSTGRIRRRSSTRSSTHEKEDVKSKMVKPADVNNKLTQVEAVQTEGVKIAVYRNYMKNVSYIISFLIAFFYIVSQGCAVGANIWLSEWSNQANEYVNDTDWRNRMLGIYGSFGLAQAITIMLAAVCMAFGLMRAATILHEKMLYSVMRSPMHFFDTTPTGRIVNRFSKDVNVMDITIAMNLRGWLMCFLAVISCFVVISMETPWFMIVILPMAVFYYFITKFYIATSRQLKRIESVSRSPIYTHFSETVTGASSIRAYGVQDIFIEQSDNKVDFNHVAYFPAIVANRWLAIGLEFIANCIILFAALFAVLGRDHLDAGSVGLSVGYSITITATLNWMVRTSSELETNLVSIERIMEYSSLDSEAEWTKEDTKPNNAWPEEGRIEFSSYKARYRENLDLVLKGIDCVIQPGERVGICGRTGAGKSSLTLALFRIIEAAGGSITIDGLEISKLGLHQLRSKLTIIPQDPVLFSGTLRQNLDPFSAYTDAKLWDALEHSHLKSFVKTFEVGLQHKIAEGGDNLSVGQRQLVCLARALLRKTTILVLDEATAAVDLETDDLIQETIRKEFADCTILTIAHRLNTIMDSTRVMVLDKGRVKEFDTPANLLQNSSSIFYGMALEAGLV